MRVSSSTCPLDKEDTKAFEEGWADHLGWTANITGVVSVYSGNFYLQPCSPDAVEYVSLPALNDADAVAFEKNNLSFGYDKFDENTTVSLPLTGAGYTDVVVSWASNNAAAVVDPETGKLTITCGEEEANVVLTATLSRGEATDTVTFEFKVLAASKGVYVAKPIEAPAAGSFVAVMDLTAVGQGVRYFDGTLNDKGALNTTDKADLAAQIVVEAVDGGYTLKVGDKYLEGYLNGTYKNLRLVDNAAVWTWNADIKTFVCAIDGVNYYFGDRDRGGYANTTMALSDIKYVTGDNLSKVGVSQYVGQLSTIEFVSAELSDADKVAADKKTLSVESETVANLVLPTAGENGSTITWASSNTAVIAADGTVVRPAVGSANAVVTLTATITLGEASETREFTVTVPALLPEGVASDKVEYTGSTTANMDGTDQAALLGLDDTVFNAVGAASTGNQNNVGLNKDGTIRFYKGGNTLTISSTKTIQSITISFKTSGGDAYVWVYVNGTRVQATNGVYTINATEFSLTSEGTGATGTISVNSIEITYSTVE